MSKKTWDKQPEETSQSYAAFCIYRDLGTGRSLLEAERIYRDNKRTTKGGTTKGGARKGGARKGVSRVFGSWSTDYNWVNRATAYDTYIEAQARKKNERKRIEQAAKAKDVLIQTNLNLLQNNLISSAIVNNQLTVYAKKIKDGKGKVEVELKELISLQRVAGDTNDKILKSLQVTLGDEFIAKEQIELSWKQELSDLLGDGVDVDEFIAGA